MSVALTVWGNDLRSVVRDRTVAVLLLVPFILLVLLRWGYPMFQEQEPDLAGYRTVVLAAFCLIAGAIPAFMASFILLDERDQGLFTALRVLPVSPAWLIGTRLLAVAALGFLYPLLLVFGTGLFERGVATGIILAGLCALAAPAVTLLVVSTAGNKIEGMAILKGIFFALALTGVATQLSGGWTLLVTPVPTYWVYRAFDAGEAGEFLLTSTLCAGLHLVLLALAYRRFRLRVF